ncbi:tRNA (N(6)-L-threonylcarbamoyladenosine(37)-C(2))-methylthiotransferase MtaB [candidate division GN15 bacterium]|nr:tRNA (N(6)-L-threonylcarbamoyladenosine(37)-C(2))-methylthiotransferase MtaB [candidate division GN15 bacterium]
MMNDKHNPCIAFKTIGCRLNQYETERMAADLNPFGLQRVKPGEPADVFVINTCTVTHKADKDCRYYIRRARRDNPNCKVVVVGCYVEHEADVLRDMDEVDVLVFNDQKEAIARILQNRLPEMFAAPDSNVTTDQVARAIRNRAWIKISDGCNQTCSFCLVTQVRGQLINRPFEQLAPEVQGYVDEGYHEVVLTGVNIGYYRDRTAHPPVADLAEFCHRVIAQTGISRLRLSSTEPQTVTDSLIELVAAEASGMCRYFHLPAQSGSSRLLKLMKRPYTQRQYLDRLERIKKANSDIIIGADLIVGFPGETPGDFDESRTLADSGLIDYLHVFSYSDRPGTAAYDMPDKVMPEIVKERHDRLAEVSHRHWQKALERQIGKLLQVIAEHKKAPDGSRMAVADNYVRVRLPLGLNPGRTPVSIRVVAARDGYVEGELTQS